MENRTDKDRLSAAMEIVSRLVNKGRAALFAGGYVRDMILGDGGKGDIDIVTDAPPNEVMRLFSRTVGVGARFGVVVVVHRKIPFEVATFRSDAGTGDGRRPSSVSFTDARHDALRRDFTINGMFYDPRSGKILDYVGGKRDLRAKVVRAIGDPATRFGEDYLRLLRAVRFAARFGFTIEQSTWDAVKSHASRITGISPERIFAEYDRMLRKPHPDRALSLLAESGLLRSTIPEVADLIGVEQPPEFHPEGDVFAHTVKALGLMAPDPSAVLAWSVLLHDIGKKVTMRRADRIRFNNHGRAGADMARAILKRLRAPNALIDSVAGCIDNHMNFMNVTAMRLATLKKLMARPTINDELELHRADCLASHGNLENYHFVKDRLAAFAGERVRPPPFIRGQDLVRLGLRPGPLFGKILREVYDLQLDEKVKAKRAAMVYVKRKWKGGKE
ncbi:MAG: CCA tRNA nucleotidyltransferase [Chitinispirillaceae bacterium]|nr:CCA tRNA nucleotidyltransferase [Chitinispirillaceae bacterium]